MYIYAYRYNKVVYRYVTLASYPGLRIICLHYVCEYNFKISYMHLPLLKQTCDNDV